MVVFALGVFIIEVFAIRLLIITNGIVFVICIGFLLQEEEKTVLLLCCIYLVLRPFPLAGCVRHQLFVTGVDASYILE